MKIFRRRVEIGIVLLTLVALALWAPQAPAAAGKSLLIEDVTGRKVEVPQPLQRAIWLEKGEVMQALGVTDRLCGIGTSDNGRFHAEYMHRLIKNTPDAGSFLEPNPERILALNPQLVICAEFARRRNEKKFKDLEDKLSGNGIKLIYLDVRSFSDPGVYLNSIRTLGAIFGVPKRAQELIDFQQKSLALMDGRLKDLKPGEKARVYFERGGDYRTFGSKYHENMWIVRAGGINVYGDENQLSAFSVSPESIIAKNPQAIIKMCNIGDCPIGYGVTDTAPMEKLRQELITRPGWANIDAVKHNRVYLLSLEAHHLDQSAAFNSFAKILYPEKFQDTEMLKDWFQKFLGLKHNGIIIYPDPAASKPKQN
jgi:iron complex transport system substrate-binding protein